MDIHSVFCIYCISPEAWNKTKHLAKKQFASTSKVYDVFRFELPIGPSFPKNKNVKKIKVMFHLEMCFRISVRSSLLVFFRR